ncbi:MAG: hypothetical protein JW795_09645 [Chitinivibrionales bacterium]|nr:hypothetical protein [Chitinivibrionales bacterium]
MNSTALTLPIRHYVCLLPHEEPAWEDEIVRSQRNRNPRIWSLAIVTVQRLLSRSTIKPQSIIVATALAMLSETQQFLDGILTENSAHPRHFLASVHNSIAGKVALDFGIKGPNLTCCDGQNSCASAIVTATLLNDDDFPLLLLVIEEKISLIADVRPWMTRQYQRYLSPDWVEGCIGFILDRPALDQKPSCTALGPTPRLTPLPQDYAESISNRFPADTLLPLSETSDSYLKPALTAYQLLKKAAPGRYAIPSYSPAAHAGAIVAISI